MQQRRFLAVLALTVLLLQPRAAAASEDPARFGVFQTAVRLAPGEYLLGPFHFSAGVFRWLQAGTYVLPWLAGVPSIYLKSPVYTGKDWFAAFQLTWIRVDLGKLSQKLGGEHQDALFHIVPLELSLSREFEGPLLLSFALQYNQVLLKGAYDDSDFKGAVAGSNSQLLAGIEYFLGRHWVLVSRIRMLLKMKAEGSSTVTYDLDPYTTMEVHAGASSKDIPGMKFPKIWFASSAIRYTAGVFNLEFGLGYGNWNVPGVNFMVADKKVMPELDLYFRW